MKLFWKFIRIFLIDEHEYTLKAGPVSAKKLSYTTVELTEGEFLVKKVMSWEGVWFEVSVTLQSTSNQTPS